MRTRLKIEGMSCQHCTQAVERSLIGVRGATEVRVDLDNQCAWIDGDCEEQALREAIEEAGFTLLSASRITQIP